MRPIRRPVEVSPETLEFHRRSLVIDLHTDSMIPCRLLRLDFAASHAGPRGFQPWMLHADIPRLKGGGVDAVCLGVVTHPLPVGAYGRALRNMAFVKRVVRDNAGSMTLALTATDVESARREGRLAALIGVEGMHMLGGRVERVEEFYRRGARYLTMAHFTSNAFAVSSADPSKKDIDLGPRGEAVVEAMNAMGMLIDVAHTHTDILRAVCARSKQPVIVSHTATRALRPTFRNVSDDDIRSVAETGGVIGVIYSNHWLSTEPDPHLDVVVDHADHIRKVGGIDCLALGSDFDGLIDVPAQMRDAAGLPALTQLFFDRGYSREDVEKLLGLNFLRVLRECNK